MIKGTRGILMCLTLVKPTSYNLCFIVTTLLPPDAIYGEGAGNCFNTTHLCCRVLVAIYFVG